MNKEKLQTQTQPFLYNLNHASMKPCLVFLKKKSAHLTLRHLSQEIIVSLFLVHFSGMFKSNIFYLSHFIFPNALFNKSL